MSHSMQSSQNSKLYHKTSYSLQIIHRILVLIFGLNPPEAKCVVEGNDSPSSTNSRKFPLTIFLGLLPSNDCKMLLALFT